MKKITNLAMTDASSHWDWASGKRCMCMRVDNLKFTDKLKEVCEVKK